MLFWGEQAPWPTADRILKPRNEPFVEPSGGDLVPVLSHTLKVKCDLFGVVYEVLIAERSHENKKLERRNSRIIGVRESCRVNTVAFSKQTIRYLPFRVLQLFVFPVTAFLLEPVGGVQKSFSSEGFEKQCNRPEFKWVQAPAYRWLRTQPDTPFNSSEPALFSL